MKAKKALQIHSFTDVDFAGLWNYEDIQSSTSVRSCSGFLFIIGRFPISWTSTRQTKTVLSTMEMDYVAMNVDMRGLYSIHSIVRTICEALDLDQKLKSKLKNKVWEDNASALTLVKLELSCMSPISGHYSIKHHWLREQIRTSELHIELHKIDTKDKLIDILTMELGRSVLT